MSWKIETWDKKNNTPINPIYLETIGEIALNCYDLPALRVKYIDYFANTALKIDHIIKPDIINILERETLIMHSLLLFDYIITEYDKVTLFDFIYQCAAAKPEDALKNMFDITIDFLKIVLGKMVNLPYGC